MDSQMVSTLIGGAIASVSAALVQGWVLWANGKQRERDERSRKEAVAYGLIIKLRDMASDLLHVQDSVAEARGKANAAGLQLYSALLPYAALPPFQTVSGEEYTFLFQARQLDLVNRLSTICAVHRNLVQLLGNYAAKRAQLGQMIGGSPSGQFTTTILNPSEAHMVGPLMSDIQAIAEDISSHADHAGEAEKLLADYNAALRPMIGESFLLAPLENGRVPEGG